MGNGGGREKGAEMRGQTNRQKGERGEGIVIEILSACVRM